MASERDTDAASGPMSADLRSQVARLRRYEAQEIESMQAPDYKPYDEWVRASDLDALLSAPASSGCINCTKALERHQEHWLPSSKEGHVGPLCDTCYDIVAVALRDASSDETEGGPR